TSSFSAELSRPRLIQLTTEIATVKTATTENAASRRGPIPNCTRPAPPLRLKRVESCFNHEFILAPCIRFKPRIKLNFKGHTYRTMINNPLVLTRVFLSLCNLARHLPFPGPVTEL